MRWLGLFLVAMSLGTSAMAQQDMRVRPDWKTYFSDKDFATLEADLKAAIKASELHVVTQASPTEAARRRGISVPDNKVIGVFNNVYAVDVLSLSTAAMIEAPIRFYLTGNKDGTATLSYIPPSRIFAPYVPEAGDRLDHLSRGLDQIFADIAEQAAGGEDSQ